jgi:hypothetical protein
MSTLAPTRHFIYHDRARRGTPYLYILSYLGKIYIYVYLKSISKYIWDLPAQEQEDGEDRSDIAPDDFRKG